MRRKNVRTEAKRCSRAQTAVGKERIKLRSIGDVPGCQESLPCTSSTGSAVARITQSVLSPDVSATNEGIL